MSLEHKIFSFLSINKAVVRNIEMSLFDDDFGQKVDLTASIRGILQNYPEGTAICKELIQNAGREGS